MQNIYIGYTVSGNGVINFNRDTKLNSTVLRQPVMLTTVEQNAVTSQLQIQGSLSSLSRVKRTSFPLQFNKEELQLRVRPSRIQSLVNDELKRSQGMSESQIISERLKASAARRRENPAGAPNVFLQKPKGREEHQNTWSRLQQNWRFIVQHSIRDTSADTYSTALRIWKKFCNTVGITDIWLQSVSAVFQQTQIQVRGCAENPFSYQVTVLLSYIAFLYGDQKVSHRTVGVYMAGLRHWFKQMFLSDFDQCFDEPIIAQARSSLHYLAVESGALDVEGKTLPFTCDMLIFARDVYLKRMPPSWLSEAIFVCLVVTFCCLMRSCEIFITGSNHYLRGMDVVYGVSVHGKERNIYPRDAYKYHLSQVLNVAITVHSAKNDWKGEGHRMFFTINDPEIGSYGFCLVRVMFAWSQKSRTRNDDSFLMFDGKYSVTYDQVSATIKNIATEFGFSSKHFHMHSLRVGAASTLAAKGHPSHYIQKMGRWQSLAFLQYIHWAVSGMAEALNTLASPLVFTSEHLKRINPAAVLRA